MSEINLGLSGKVAVVTGGSRGLGRTIGLAMAKQGMKVAICARRQDTLDEALEDFRKVNADIFSRVADVSNFEQVAGFFKEVEDRFARLDVLVNNVGINMFTPSTVEAEEGIWDRIINTNLKSAYLTSGQAIKLMKKTGSGRIINISSIAAKKAAVGMGIYCISKAALEMLTKVLALEHAKDNINVNAIAPYVIRTQFSKPFWGKEAMLSEITKDIPMGRIAETDDVVGTVLFLSSGLSDFITGEIITVDGGVMAR